MKTILFIINVSVCFLFLAYFFQFKNLKKMRPYSHTNIDYFLTFVHKKMKISLPSSSKIYIYVIHFIRSLDSNNKTQEQVEKYKSFFFFFFWSSI